MSFHLYFIHHFFFENLVKYTVTAILKFKIFNWSFFFGVCILAALIASDYYIISKLIQAFNDAGFLALVHELIYIGPHLFNFFGQLMVEIMASAIGIGFWPGGTFGIVLSTIFSFLINCFEFKLIMDSLLEKYQTDC